MMLTGEEEELLDIEPQEALEELLARVFEAHRYRQAAAHLGERLERERGVRFRSAPLPAGLRRAIVPPAEGSEDPALLGEAIGSLLRMPPTLNLDHVAVPRVPVAERLAHLRALLRRGSFSFEEAVRGADRMTVAVTLFALLELYKRGEAEWRQEHNFGDIAVHARPTAAAGQSGVSAERSARAIAG
jgi:segregation and condensation protein A